MQTEAQSVAAMCAAHDSYVSNLPDNYILASGMLIGVCNVLLFPQK